jgi:patatin-like phospholipase/acyl hydrolase
MAEYFRILSIDGGGIRGIIPAQVLISLEEKLQNETGLPDARVADFFDLIAGTSTGGILACLFLCPDQNVPDRPRFTAQDAVDLYVDRGDDIFDVPLWHKVKSAGGIADEKYPADGLEEVIEDYLGDLRLSDLLRPCLITAYDIKSRRAFFFTQHDAKKDPKQNFSLRDVARATSAAPTFFECAKVKLGTDVYSMIDGGVFANNPALCAYAEARTMGERPTAKQMMILSLGTGEVKKSYSYKAAKDWGAIGWIRPLIDIIMSGASETVDYQLRQIYDAVGAKGQYLRIQTLLGPRNADMDNVEPENLAELKEIGAFAAANKDAELDQFIQGLIM